MTQKQVECINEIVRVVGDEFSDWDNELSYEIDEVSDDNIYITFSVKIWGTTKNFQLRYEVENGQYAIDAPGEDYWEFSFDDHTIRWFYICILHN